MRADRAGGGDDVPPPEGERLQKVLAHAGIASRRASEALIAAGRVSVNGVIVTKLGTRVDPARDRILVDGRPIVGPCHARLHVTHHAKRQGLLGFTAAVLMENEPMLKTFAKGGFDISGKLEFGFYNLKLAFRN